ncbi:unnamed protein product [Vicia faba]|uniref:Uncharacterized protein n=1 Tax=Vicia faba TaxID=3906 RepID=A0AAV0ZHE9_VICFA|nr:unnamed protein product [Vicia faba]
MTSSFDFHNLTFSQWHDLYLDLISDSTSTTRLRLYDRPLNEFQISDFVRTNELHIMPARSMENTSKTEEELQKSVAKRDEGFVVVVIEKDEGFVVVVAENEGLLWIERTGIDHGKLQYASLVMKKIMKMEAN